MRVVFKTFRAANGDCIFFILEEVGKRFSIMVDCGRYTQPIKDYIEKKLNKQIDLIIVTHIDADHVKGVIQMLNEMPDLTIGEIWFNSYQRANVSNTIPLTEKQNRYLKRLYGKIPQVVDILDTKVNANHAMSLSETILNNPTIKGAWRKDPIKVGMKDYQLCDGLFGKITILSPTQDALNDLDNEFLYLFYEFFYENHPKALLEKDTTIYELLLRVAQERDSYVQLESEKIAVQQLTKQTISTYCEKLTTPLSSANKASIAFVWEYHMHKILFLGDASPDTVIKSLTDLYGNEVSIFDAVKVSHHGSAHSTTQKMMELIESPHFFFTGGSGNKRPHIEAIARIIYRQLQQGIDSRMLHFNYRNEWTKELEKAELQQELGYLIDYNSNELIYEL